MIPHSSEIKNPDRTPKAAAAINSKIGSLTLQRHQEHNNQNPKTYTYSDSSGLENNPRRSSWNQLQDTTFNPSLPPKQINKTQKYRLVQIQVASIKHGEEEEEEEEPTKHAY